MNNVEDSILLLIITSVFIHAMLNAILVDKLYTNYYSKLYNITGREMVMRI